MPRAWPIVFCEVWRRRGGRRKPLSANDIRRTIRRLKYRIGDLIHKRQVYLLEGVNLTGIVEAISLRKLPA